MARLQQHRVGFKASKLIATPGTKIKVPKIPVILNGRKPKTKKVNYAKSKLFLQKSNQRDRLIFEAITKTIKKNPSISQEDLSVEITRQLKHLKLGQSTPLRILSNAIKFGAITIK
jgi:hypothetical protein